MTYEVVSVSLGATSVWTVEAPSLPMARIVAKRKLREVVTNGQIVGVRPLGYKPKKNTA